MRHNKLDGIIRVKITKYGVKGGKSTLAPELICSLPNKKFLKNSSTFQKKLKQFGDEQIQILYIHTKFHDEMTFSALCKKDKITVLQRYFLNLILITRFVFYTNFIS